MLTFAPTSAGMVRRLYEDRMTHDTTACRLMTASRRPFLPVTVTRQHASAAWLKRHWQVATPTRVNANAPPLRRV